MFPHRSQSSTGQWGDAEEGFPKARYHLANTTSNLLNKWRATTITYQKNNKKTKKMMAKQIKDRLQLLIMAFCLVIGGITLTACGDDNDDDSTKKDETPTGELAMDNLVGTWKIMHFKSVEYNESTGEVSDECDESWEDEKDYIVFYPDGRVCYYEYSEDEYASGGAWHEDGKTKLIIENGRPMFFGGDFLDPKILSLSGNDMTIQWTFKDYVYVKKNIAKLHRETKRTDVLIIEEDD